jgi:hypothetical protein
MMEKPALESKVRFVLGGGPNIGKVRTATVRAHWSGDATASALKVGKSLEEFERTDGMRLTLDVHARRDDQLGYENHAGTYGCRFSIYHAEYDPTGSRPGTWHTKTDALKRRFPHG